MKILKFIRNVAPYGEGEVAGFDEVEADRLVGLGVAVKHVVDEAEESDAEDAEASGVKPKQPKAPKQPKPPKE